MPDLTHLKWQYEFEETFNAYLQAKNWLYPSRFPWDTTKILQTCYFGYVEHVQLRTPKVILSTCRMLLSISYFCIFRYINKARFYIPLNICILVLSKLAVCSPVSYYGYAFYHGSRGNIKVLKIELEDSIYKRLKNLLKHFQILLLQTLL